MKTLSRTRRSKSATVSPEQVRLDFRDHVGQRVLAEVGEIHEGWNARRELDQFFLNLLAERLVFLLLVGEFFLLLRGQLSVFGFLLELLNLLTLVDDRFDDVVAKRAPALDPFDRRHRFFALEHPAQRVVIDVDQHRRFPLAREQGSRGSGHGDVENAARIDLRHVGAVVSEHRQERDEVRHRLFGVRFARREANAILRKLAQRASGGEVEDVAIGLCHELGVGIVAFGVLDRPRRLHAESRLEIAFG